MKASTFRWSVALLMVFAVVLAACQPAATPTPTARPTEAAQAADNEAAENEAADNEAAENEAADNEAAENEAADNEAAENEAADNEAAENEAADNEAAENEAADNEAAENEAADNEAAENEAADNEAAENEAADNEAAENEAADNEAADNEAADNEAAENEAADNEAAENESADNEAADNEAADNEAAMETETPMADETDEAAGTPVAQASGDVVTVAPDENVIIGLSAALSGEGLAPLGTDIQRGAEIALSERSTVTVDGQEWTVVLDPQDDLCSPEGGQTVANRFVSDENVVAVVGPMCSAGCRAAIPIFDSANYTTISPSCTNADLSRGGSTSFNRVVVSDGLQGRVAAEFIYNNLGVTRIAIIHDGSAYGEGLVEVVAEAFEALGGEVVASDAVSVGETDFRALLEDIAQSDPELIYFGGFAAEGARLTEQREDAGLEDVIFMAADGVWGSEYIELTGEAAEGSYASRSIPESSDALAGFLTTYEETYGEQPPAPYHGHAYDAINIFMDAIEAVGTVDADGNLLIDREALRQYVRELDGYRGLVGTFTNDGTGEMVVTDIEISQVQDGVFVPVAIGRVSEDGEIVLEAPDAATEEAMDEAADNEAAANDEAEDAGNDEMAEDEAADNEAAENEAADNEAAGDAEDAENADNS